MRLLAEGKTLVLQPSGFLKRDKLALIFKTTSGADLQNEKLYSVTNTFF